MNELLIEIKLNAIKKNDSESYEEVLEDLEKLQSDISEYENDEKNNFGHGIEEWL